MNRDTLGWLLVISGLLVTIADQYSQADAKLKGITVDQTPFGAIIGPINTKLPVPLGYLLLGGGAIILWVVPK